MPSTTYVTITLQQKSQEKHFQALILKPVHRYRRILFNNVVTLKVLKRVLNFAIGKKLHFAGI